MTLATRKHTEMGFLFQPQRARHVDGAAAAARAEETYTALEPEDQKAACRMLIRLVLADSGTHATQGGVHRNELTGTMSVADGRALTALTSAGLVVHDGDVVKIVHRRLSREWPRLRAWLAADQVWLRSRDRLAADADEWHRDGREKSRLYRGARLAAAREQLEAAPVNKVDRVTRAFVEASIAMEAAELFLEQARQARERRAARWFRWLEAGLTVLLLLAAVVAGVAFHQSVAQLSQWHIPGMLGAPTLPVS